MKKRLFEDERYTDMATNISSEMENFVEILLEKYGTEYDLRDLSYILESAAHTQILTYIIDGK